MADSRFFTHNGALALSDIADKTGSELIGQDKQIEDVASLSDAGADDLSFLDNRKYVDQFKASNAGAIFVHPKYKEYAPEGCALLVNEDPYRAYAIAATLFYSDNAMQSGISEDTTIHPDAKVDDSCTIEAGARIGAGVEIGANSYIGSNAVLSHCIVGSHCIIHRGVAIGQDGFGFAMGPKGHLKVPQLGRVIIEDAVEIGANSCIDRGAGPDTVIGAGTKIDNLVQIAHNVRIGRGCVIVAQTGISGSTVLGDGVVTAGQSGIAGHLNLGSGVQVAAQSGVMTDIPAGEVYGGSPAIPVKDWHRQTIALKKLTRKKKEA